MVNIPPNLDKQNQPTEQTELFRVGSNKESLLTPWALLAVVAVLFILSLFKMPGLILVSLPVMSIFLWMAITLIKQSRQPWIVANKSCLEIKYRDSNNRIVFLIVPWGNINSIELSQPYKDQLIIKLQKPMNMGSDGNISQVVTSNEFYDIDPDELLSKLSNCMGTNYSNISQNKYVSNIIPLSDRVVEILLVFIIIGWGIYSVIYDDLPLPTKGRPWHLHGIAMWLMLGALIAAAANLSSWILDHYDQRDNERKYRAFRAYSRITGYSLFCISLIVSLLVEFYH